MGRFMIKDILLEGVARWCTSYNLVDIVSNLNELARNEALKGVIS